MPCPLCQYGGEGFNEFRASYYIDELLAPHSVNTAPIATIDAFVKGGERTLKLPLSAESIEAHKRAVADAGVVMEDVIDQQIPKGLEAFKTAF
jgi:transaldolase